MKNIAKLYNKHSIMLKPLVHEIKKNVRNSDVVLDLGCGSGVYVNLIEKQVGNIGKLIGIDLDDEMINFCKSKFKKSNISFKKILAEKLSSLDIKVDVVFSSLVLQFTNLGK